jgi:triosephosphate isomerase
MARTPFLAGNWKMMLTIGESVDLVTAFAHRVAGIENVNIAVCPSFAALPAVASAIQGAHIKLGGQDMHWECAGAYTGMISPVMLKEVGCHYVILGHSERRGRFAKPPKDLTPELLAVFGDNDHTVNRKVLSALKYRLCPIICCGELWDQREKGQTDNVVCGQVTRALENVLAEQMANVTIAYEPVWAIGEESERECDPPEANRVCGLIRETIARLYNPEVSAATIIQYGGSVSQANIRKFLAREHVDGALIGRASSDAATFAEIVRIVAGAR